MKTRTDALAALVLTGILAGGLLGAVTNAVNGKVSPTYFIHIMGWSHLENVWRASIAQGVFEGLLFGSFFSLVFTAGVGWISRVQCPYFTALRYLGIIVVVALICWCVGGLAGMGGTGAGRAHPTRCPGGAGRHRPGPDRHTGARRRRAGR